MENRADNGHFFTCVCMCVCVFVCVDNYGSLKNVCSAKCIQIFQNVFHQESSSQYHLGKSASILMSYVENKEPTEV